MVRISYSKNRAPVFHFHLPFLTVQYWDDGESIWFIKRGGKNFWLHIMLGKIEIFVL